jgi:hypothetical protein
MVLSKQKNYLILNHQIINSCTTRYDRINDPTHNTLFGHGIETINPTTGISGLGAPTQTTIPTPALPFTPNVSVSDRYMTSWNTSSVILSYLSQGSLTANESATALEIKFTATASNALFAWGGHIGRAIDWGVGNSAGGISGSPYHTRAIGICRITGTVLCTNSGDFKGGNQDRSLSADAVCGVIATATTTNVSCFGGTNGTASATGLNGTIPFSYLWSTTPAQSTATATGLTAGNYTVTVTDKGGCKATTSVTITQPVAALTCSAVATNPLCNSANGGTGGTITVTALGGTGAKSYAISGGNITGATTGIFTGLTDGTYTVTTTDANGCTTTCQATILAPTVLGVNSISACNNGTATVTLTITGGTAPYSVLNNTGTGPFTVNSGASYSFTVTDANGCTTTTTGTAATCVSYCTYTQGYWANGNRTAIIEQLMVANNLPNIPSVVDVSNPNKYNDITIGRDLRSLQISSAACVSALLPGGGNNLPLAAGNAISKATACTAGNNTLSNRGKIQNNMAANVIALELNFRLNRRDGKDLGVYNLTSNPNCLPISSIILTAISLDLTNIRKEYPTNHPLFLSTVKNIYISDLFIYANRYLGGKITASNSLGGSLTSAITAVNEAWDECRKPTCATVAAVIKTREAEYNSVGAKAKELSIYPNPADDNVIVDLEGFIGYKADLVMYNMTGKAVYQKQYTEINQLQEQINLDKFSNGLYFIVLKPEGENAKTVKLMISK